MASDNILLRDNFPAGADLTGKENLFAKFNSSGQLVLAGAGEGGHRIVRGAKQGENVTVDLVGISKITLGTGGGRAGQAITSDANGRAVGVASTNVINGTLIAAGSSGEIVPFLAAVPGARAA